MDGCEGGVNFVGLASLAGLAVELQRRGDCASGRRGRRRRGSMTGDFSVGGEIMLGRGRVTQT